MKQLYLLLITLLVSLSAYAEKSGTCGANLKWKLTDEGVLTITGTGEMYNWEDRHARPWSPNSNIKQVIIGDGVTDIGDYAFSYYSSLTSITIPNSVTDIGSHAFVDCRALTSVTIPNSVTDIGPSAFLNCYSLASVTIGNSLTTIGDHAFFGCHSLTSITIPNSVITIGNSAFSSCYSLASVTIGNSLTTIGNDAFRGCQAIASITIPNSVTTIGAYAFSGCSSLTSIIIPNSVTTIGNDAFYGCRSLASITIPNSVITIGNEAFLGCRSLASITIPNSVITIGDHAFSSCDSLASVTIGKHVTNIGTDILSNNSVAKVIWLTKRPPSGYSSVKGFIHYVPNTSYSQRSNAKVYPSLNDIFEVGGVKYVPVSLSERTCDAIDCIYTGDAYEVNIDKKVNYKGLDMVVREINPYTFHNCHKITKANININGSIGEHAFSGCSSLKSARIHKDVRELKNNVFRGCGALSTFIIEDRNTSLKIGSNGDDPFFKDCKLDSVYIGGKMDYNTSSYVGFSPFYNNTSLRTVKISDTETTIYDKEFYGCNNLKNVSFGKGLESIGANAFIGCGNVKQITSEAVTPPDCSRYAFDGVKRNECKLFVPENSIDAYKKADGWKEFFLIEGTTTGIINNIYNKTENVDVYTIDGIKRLSKASVNEINALPKGVYIINGKKIVIK